MADFDYKALALSAIEARKSSYAPYSEFMVGAALLTDSGRIFTGANIENAAYSPSVCAERTAFFKAVSEGERNFSAIAVAGWQKYAEVEKRGFAYPCGVCRQVMMEFCDKDTFEVIIAESGENFRIHVLKELLPFGFGPQNLE